MTDLHTTAQVARHKEDTMRKTLLQAGLALVALLLAAPAASAADGTPVSIVIENHRFMPSEVTVPAGQRVELVIENRDPTPEEFESEDLRREKVIVGNSKASLWVGPLKPGTYSFYGEYHKATATGTIVAK